MLHHISTEAPVICINPDIHKITPMILKIINTVTLFPRHRNWRHPVKYVITNDIRRTIGRERRTASRLRSSSTISDREESGYAVGAYNWVNDARMCITTSGRRVELILHKKMKKKRHETEIKGEYQSPLMIHHTHGTYNFYS